MATTWIEKDNGSLLYKSGSIQSSNVAAFDFDGTLARSDRGLDHIKELDDWVPLTDDVPGMLRKLVNDGWTIVIFSNQLKAPWKDIGKIANRISTFFDYVGIRPTIYLSMVDDHNRKPAPGMWNTFLTDSKLKPSEATFYCGDADGVNNTNPLYRWSEADSGFAAAAGLAYYTPNEIFQPNEMPEVPQIGTIIVVVAPHAVCFSNFLLINKIVDSPLTPVYRREDIVPVVEQGGIPFYYNQLENASLRGRKSLMQLSNYNFVNYWFTVPVKHLMGVNEYNAIKHTINKYARAFERPNNRNDVGRYYRIN